MVQFPPAGAGVDICDRLGRIHARENAKHDQICRLRDSTPLRPWRVGLVHHVSDAKHERFIEQASTLKKMSFRRLCVPGLDATFNISRQQ